MKLYLSSYRIPDLEVFSNFVGKDASKIKLGLVLNSKDNRPLDYREEKRKELFEYFSSLGFTVEEVDLREYFGKTNLEERLKEFDVVWMNGGNTYMLRWVIERSNAGGAIKNALDGGVVYGGDSAGAIIAGPTLKYFDSADDPTVVDKAIYEGLRLTNLVILPHWGSEEYSEVLEETRKNLIDDGYETIKLADDEYVLIEDGKTFDSKKL